MKIIENGVARDMTAQELANYELAAATVTDQQTPEQRIADLEEALELLLSEVTE